MRGLARGIVLLMLICMVFSTGCAKKMVQPIGGEITPPPSKAPVVAPQPAGPEITPQPLEMPQMEGGPPAAAPVTTLGREEEIKNFEQNDVYFDFDQYNITPEGRKILAQKASFLKVHPELKVRIEGHCDERGTTEYNLALGERRANEVKKYLAFLGIADNRISTISYGKERPAIIGHNEEAWAKNRRVHLDILGGSS
jgi:peptidoglycan-associated lipoprotein